MKASKSQAQDPVCPNCGTTLPGKVYYCPKCDLEVDVLLYYNKTPCNDEIEDMKKARQQHWRVMLTVSGVYLLIWFLIYVFFLRASQQGHVGW